MRFFKIKFDSHGGGTTFVEPRFVPVVKEGAAPIEQQLASNALQVEYDRMVHDAANPPEDLSGMAGKEGYLLVGEGRLFLDDGTELDRHGRYSYTTTDMAPPDPPWAAALDTMRVEG